MGLCCKRVRIGGIADRHEIGMNETSTRSNACLMGQIAGEQGTNEHEMAAIVTIAAIVFNVPYFRRIEGKTASINQPGAVRSSSSS